MKVSPSSFQSQLRHWSRLFYLHLPPRHPRSGPSRKASCSSYLFDDIYIIIKMKKPTIADFLIAKENRFSYKGVLFLLAYIQGITFIWFTPKLSQAIWPTILTWIEESQYEKWKVFLVGLILWHVCLVAFFNLIMYGIYHIEHPFFEQFKINQNPWPWNENRSEWIIKLKNTLKLQGFNMIVMPAVLIFIDLYFQNFQIRFSFKSEDLPDPFTFVAMLSFMMITEDLAFYIFHRLAHWRVIYPYFHKHHHSFVTTVSIGAEHFHPFDYLIGVLLPGTIGPNLLGNQLHAVTYMAWILVRTGEGVDGHSGYEFPWSPYRLIPFAASASYHDYHHTHNVGNYSSFLTIWDCIFGNNSHYVEQRAELKKIN